MVLEILLATTAISVGVLVWQKRNKNVLLQEYGLKAWCYWNEKEIVHCSKKLQGWLGVKKNKISLEDFKESLPKEILSQLQEYLNLEHDSKFCLEYNKRFLHFYIQKVVERKTTLLWIEDLSSLYSEIKFESKRNQELQAENNRFRMLLDNAPIIIWHRNEQEKIEYCNKAYADCLEKTPDLVLQQNLELIDAYRKDSPYQIALRAHTQRSTQKTQSYIVHKGQRKLWELTIIPWKQESFGYAADLTVLQQLNDDLAKHIKSHQDVLQQLPSPIAIFSSDTRLIFFNTSYMKLFDFDESWLLRKPTLADVLENLRSRRQIPETSNFLEYKKKSLALFQTLLSPQEDLLHTPNGKILRRVISPHPLGGLIYIFDDISERLSLEQKYNTLDAVQKTTLDYLQEGIACFGSDNRLSFYNPVLLKLLDLPDGQNHINTHINDLFHDIHVMNLQEKFSLEILHMFDERQSKSGHLIYGQQKVLKYTYIPLPDGSNLLSFMDSSDSWRIEQALKEKNQALEDADQIKSEFLSYMSYEIRSPLNMILDHADLMLQETANQNQQEYCRNIVKSSQRLLSLIDDMLDFANIESGKTDVREDAIYLHLLLVGVQTLIQGRVNDHGIIFSMINASKITLFYGDEQRIKQFLFKLLTNSMKYLSSQDRISLMCYDKDEFLYFEIVLPKKVFKKTDDSFSMPLIKRLLELQNGTIDIASTKDSGKIICSIPLKAGYTKTVSDAGKI